MKKIINVDIENANKRIDVFLSKIDENYSRTTIQKMIENLKKLGIYELLQGKVSVHLLKAD